MDRLLSFRYPPYNVSFHNIILLGFDVHPIQAAKLKAMGRLIRVSLPARPTGPPKPQVSGGKFTKWFTFLLALVLAGGLMKRQLKIV